MQSFTRVIAALSVAALLAGCGGMRFLPGGRAIVTDAQERAILEMKAGDGSVPGRVKPAYLHCAEPSPDIAVAVSKGFNLGTSLSVPLPQGVEPKLAFAVSHATAQAMAQLTERLATIQLLRDGLHRACEAYANGAISDTIYAVMLSRFDKLMVTMLLGELTAGAFGRSLAALGTDADALSSALIDSGQGLGAPEKPSTDQPSGAPGGAVGCRAIAEFYRSDSGV